MTGFDYAVLAIIAISVLLSLIHGLVREVLALASWIVAFIVAQLYAADVAPLLSAGVANPSLRQLVAFLATFVAALVLMTLLAIAVSTLVKTAGLGALDRLLGAIFGFVRGIAIVMIAVLLAGFTPLPREPLWREAMFSAPLEALANVIKVWLPYDFSKYVNFD